MGEGKWILAWGKYGQFGAIYPASHREEAEQWLADATNQMWRDVTRRRIDEQRA